MRSVYKGVILGLGAVFLLGCQPMEEPNSPMATIFQAPKSNDATISEAVNEALMNNVELSRYRFRVDTVNAVVTVSGYVKTIRQSDKAGEIASKVPGVRSVHNNVIVRK